MTKSFKINPSNPQNVTIKRSNLIFDNGNSYDIRKIQI